MKRYLSVLLLLSLMALAGMMLGSSESVEASTRITYEDLKLTEVSDIEVFNNYKINNLHINNDIYPYNESKIYRFTLEKDGFVKLILTADKVSKINSTYSSSGYRQTYQESLLTATVYRDDKLLFTVIPTITARGSLNPTKPSVNGETKDKVALDKGTYYVAIRTDKYQQSSNTVSQVRGQAGFILYYQSVKSDEFIRPSSVGQENPIEIDNTFHGLLTVANPKDYYTFKLKERSLLKIEYMYESTKRAKFVLYGQNREVLLTKQFNGNNVLNQEELLLEAGQYYISLESVTAGDGGRTSLYLNAKPYTTELTQINRSKNSYIEVETIERPKEVRYLKGRLSQEDIQSSSWRTANLITEDLQFGVNSAGYYSVRVVDDKGNMTIDNIRVTVCDSTAPAKPKITTYAANSYEVKGSAEKNSTVTVVHNNRSYTCTANSKGNYSCVLATRLSKGARVEVYAADISGNISESAVVAVK